MYSLYAPTSNCDVALYDMMVGQVRSVMRDASGMVAERVFLAVECNAELGMLKEEEELVGFCGLYCWRRRKADLESCEQKSLCGWISWNNLDTATAGLRHRREVLEVRGTHSH